MFYDIYCELCTKNGFTPSGAATKIGFNRASVTVWKNTGKAPKQDLLLKIASFFGVTTDYLLGGEQKENAPTPEDEREIDDEDLKAAFWGGEKDLSPDELDDLWEDVREYARYKAEQRRKKKYE